ncbi:MAG: class I SAM-dependent methyltransferase, partial [Anaerolineales bacterium]|nr:class I SAM-dependent methyltransferase [Anaerolineales bacterium]
KAGDLILDIATGTAVIPRELVKKNEYPDMRIIGLDITESMLKQGKKEIHSDQFSSPINLTCGDAVALPFCNGSFDVIVTGLASHHMNIPDLLSEVQRVLKPDGFFSMIDVGTSPLWKSVIVRSVLRVIAFTYFLFKENYSRALAEASALSNVQTIQDWEKDLNDKGFNSIKTTLLDAKYKWFPEPFAILANKEKS